MSSSSFGNVKHASNIGSGGKKVVVGLTLMLAGSMLSSTTHATQHWNSNNAPNNQRSSLMFNPSSSSNQKVDTNVNEFLMMIMKIMLLINRKCQN